MSPEPPDDLDAMISWLRQQEALQAANDEGELTDDQLSAVAGGQGAMLLALGTLFVGLP